MCCWMIAVERGKNSQPWKVQDSLDISWPCQAKLRPQDRSIGAWPFQPRGSKHIESMWDDANESVGDCVEILLPDFGRDHQRFFRMGSNLGACGRGNNVPRIPGRVDLGKSNAEAKRDPYFGAHKMYVCTL